MCIKIKEKSFTQLQKQRIKFFFFLVVSNLTYGKNISDNEHQLISVFVIQYSVFEQLSPNSTIRIRYSVYFQKTNYSVFVKFSKTNIFGIRSIFTICCNSESNHRNFIQQHLWLWKCECAKTRSGTNSICVETQVIFALAFNFFSHRAIFS